MRSGTSGARACWIWAAATGSSARKSRRAARTCRAWTPRPRWSRRARARGLDARVGDGQALGALFGDNAFDAVFSNAALHWMPDADAVLGGVAATLRPGGRFVGEAGGHGNVAAVATALLAALAERGVDGRTRWPWRFPTDDEWGEALERHGFAVDECRLVPRPTPLPTGIEGWLVTFADPFLGGLDEAARDAVRARAAELLAPSLRDSAGRWTADYVRLRFVARLRG